MVLPPPFVRLRFVRVSGDAGPPRCASFGVSRLHLRVRLPHVLAASSRNEFSWKTVMCMCLPVTRRFCLFPVSSHVRLFGFVPPFMGEYTLRLYLKPVRQALGNEPGRARHVSACQLSPPSGVCLPAYVLFLWHSNAEHYTLIPFQRDLLCGYRFSCAGSVSPT